MEGISEAYGESLALYELGELGRHPTKGEEGRL